jgi:hypothetical protein
VAKLGLRYLSINVSDKLGHPLIRTECVKVARVTPVCVSLVSIGRCGARLLQGPGCGGTVGPGAVHTFVGIGRVHKSVLGSLNPRKITTPSNTTSHFLLSKITLHPALHSGLIPMREAMHSEGTICPMSTVRRPGIRMSHTCGLYPFAVGQIDREGHRSRTFVVDIRALHYKNGGSTRAGNGLISGDC